MNIRDHASQFTIHVFAADLDRGAGIKVALAQAGYDASFFEDRDTLMSRLENKPPHLLIFPTGSLREPLSDFIEQTLKLLPELRFIVIAQASQFETLAAYNAYGLVDLLEDKPEGLAARAVFSVDRACEALYLKFQNEQLLQELRKSKSDFEALRQQSQQMDGLMREKDQMMSRRGPPLGDRIRNYVSAESKEDLISRWMLELGGLPCVYFTYLPSVRSLMATHSSVGSAQGVSCQLEGGEAQDFPKQVSLGVVPPSLAQTVKKAFGFETCRLLPLFVHGQMEGLVATPAQIEAAKKAQIDDEFAVFSLSYSNLAMEKRLDVLEIMDPVMGLFNREYGQQKLREEWNRARRISQPLSVVKVALDDFYELEQTLGEATRDQLLANVAQLVQKTSRTNDNSFRSGTNEITMILPHCNRQGAMIRAERLRRIIESSQMLENGLKVSVSLGISEYPSLCSNAQDLELTAAKALTHILEKGGNRLCLFKAPATHKPDFEVSAEALGSRS